MRKSVNLKKVRLRVMLLITQKKNLMRMNRVCAVLMHHYELVLLFHWLCPPDSSNGCFMYFSCFSLSFEIKFQTNLSSSLTCLKGNCNQPGQFASNLKFSLPVMWSDGRKYGLTRCLIQNIYSQSPALVLGICCQCCYRWSFCNLKVFISVSIN